MKKPWGNIYFGLLLLLIGVGFLAQNYGAIDLGNFLGTWWPTYIFIAWGIFTLLGHKSRAGVMFGGFMIILGATWQLDNLELIPRDASDLLWPLVVIFFGAMILYRAFRPPQPFKGMSQGTDTIFGEQHHNFDGEDFGGMETSTILGETKIDLRRANFPNQKTTLETSVILGATIVYLPKDIKVSKKVDVILGDLEDHTTNTSDNSKIIELTGSVILGSIELRN